MSNTKYKQVLALAALLLSIYGSPANAVPESPMLFRSKQIINACDLVDLGRMDAAEAICRQLIASSATDVEGHLSGCVYDIVQRYMGEKQYDKAIALYECLVDHKTKHVELNSVAIENLSAYYGQLARYCETAKKPELQEKYLEMELSLREHHIWYEVYCYSPNSKKLYFANMFEPVKSYKPLESGYGESNSIHDEARDVSFLMYMLCKTQLEHKNFAGAEQTMARRLLLAKDLESIFEVADVYVSIANVKKEQGKFDEEEASLQRSLQLLASVRDRLWNYSRLSVACSILGDCYERHGKFQLAADYYRQALTHLASREPAGKDARELWAKLSAVEAKIGK